MMVGALVDNCYRPLIFAEEGSQLVDHSRPGRTGAKYQQILHALSFLIVLWVFHTSKYPGMG
jgi:hypothetical protein